MSKLSVMILALAGATSALPALAAPNATPQEADRLRTLFERYVGHAAAGEAATVLVTPEGTSYRASFDLQQMMRPLGSFGVTLEPAMQALVLTPNDNGTWHVTSDAMPPLVVHVKDQTTTMKASSYKYDGTFDPKLGMFLNQTLTEDGSTVDQDSPVLTQHRRSGHSVLTESAVPADADRGTNDYHYALSDVTAQLTMRSPSPKSAEAVEPASPPVEISYTLPSGTIDVHIDRFHVRSLTELWAFFVAHPTRETITASQEELRGLLKAALPLLSAVKETASLSKLAVQSQVGEFHANTLTTSLDVTDVAAASKLASVLSVDGLKLPALPLPAWSMDFLPTSIDLRPTVDGLHIDDGAREAVNTFDLSHDGFTPEQTKKIGALFWPGDGTLTLAPSHITSPLLDLRLEGEGTIGTIPAGHLTVTAKGLDQAIASLQAVVATDETAAQVLAQFVAAKNLAKPNPDGSYVWLIEAVANGPLSVNGIPLK